MKREPVPLHVTPVSRNLSTRVTYLGLEWGDLLRIAGGMSLAFFVSGYFDARLLGLPLNLVMLFVVPAVAWPSLRLLKYGRQRGYLTDRWQYRIRPKAYSAQGRDSEYTEPYLAD